MEVPKSLMRKTSKEDEQTLAKLNLIHRQCPLVSCLRHIINILLTELSRSV